MEHSPHMRQVTAGRTSMRLLHSPKYAIRVITPSTSDAEPTCEVVIAGVPTGKVLQGAVFEAALKWNEYTLLFLTDDVPFEDTLNIYLLDQHLNVEDYARMYFMYSTGIFSDLDLTENDSVSFSFLGQKIWTLKLFPENRFVIPIISDPLGVHRPFGLSRRFQLSGRPLPHTTDSLRTANQSQAQASHDKDARLER